MEVRLACHREGLSRREASRQFGIDRKTVAKILLHSEPPGYRRRQPPKRPKLAPFTDIIDGILEEDRTVHRKQRHTAKRIFERLRDEHGFTGKQTIVKDYVRERHLGLRPAYLVGQGSLRFGLQPRRGVCPAQRPDAGRRMENGRRSNITASSTSPSMTNALCVGTVPPVSTT